MKLKTFANIDLSTCEARNEVNGYLSNLQCDFNICENTPEEIVNCAYSMLKALTSLNYKLVVFHSDFYNGEDKITRIQFLGREQERFAIFLHSAYEYLNRVRRFGAGVDEFIPAIRKIAKQLRYMVLDYTCLNVKVADYTVSLIN